MTEYQRMPRSYKDKSCFRISLQSENESRAVYSLMVHFLRNGTKNLQDYMLRNGAASLVIGLSL